MNKLKWGFDVDGVVADFVPLCLQVCKKLYNINLGYNEITKFDWHQITKEQLDKCVEVSLDNMQLIEPINGAFRFIRKYYFETKYVPIFITARKEKYARATADWISMYLNSDYRSVKKLPCDNIQDKIPFELILSNDKPCYIANRKIDVFIEDRVRNAKEITDELYSKVLLIDTPYNRHIEESNSLLRVSGWQEIDKIYESIKQ